jgi:hypothetical protein
VAKTVNHQRLLGTLFIAWAVIQLGAAVAAFNMAEPETAPPPFFWGMVALLVVAYAWTGLQLRQRRLGDQRVRVVAIALSVFSLFSFPVGTVLGAYALWVLFGNRQQVRAAA